MVASGSGGRLKPLVWGLLLALLLLRVVLVACMPLQPAGADPVLLLEAASSPELPLELTGTLLGDPRSSVGTGSCRALLQLPVGRTELRFGDCPPLQEGWRLRVRGRLRRPQASPHPLLAAPA